jgi:hypothetical protein
MMRGGTAVVVSALLLQALAVRAAPLDKDECAKLKTEQSQLERDGVRGSMARGPEWAKANLAGDKLEQIHRLIDVDEQLLFRCQGRPLVNIRETEPAVQPAVAKEHPKRPVAKAAKPQGAERKEAAPVKKAAASPPAPAAKAGAKEAPPAQKAAATTPAQPPAAKEATPADGKAPPPAKAAAKAKAKTKARDAYQPQAPDWSTNPFADQAAPAAKK